MSNTEQEVSSQSKWKDPEFKRIYSREYNRKRNGIKRHPNITEDGRKWSEVNQYPPEFESMEAWQKFRKDRAKEYNRKRALLKKPRIHCQICSKDLISGKYEAHVKSVQHKKYEAVISKFRVKETAC